MARKYCITFKNLLFYIKKVNNIGLRLKLIKICGTIKKAEEYLIIKLKEYEHKKIKELYY